jgi:hypothetical protein
MKLRKIQETGTEIELESYSVFSPNHINNYGFWNVLLGWNNAENAVGSTRTVAIGNEVLRELQGGHRNVGIGTFSMSQMVGGERNVSIGADAMLAMLAALRCVAIGDGALYNGANSEDNVAIGSHSLYGYGSEAAKTKCNVSIGTNAGFKNGGSYNTYLGYQAGYRNVSGEDNVMLGYNAFGCNGTANTFVGASIALSSSISNSIGLGKAAIPKKSNQMMLGSAAITEVVLCGNKKINFNEDGTVTWETI